MPHAPDITDLLDGTSGLVTVMRTEPHSYRISAFLKLPRVREGTLRERHLLRGSGLRLDTGVRTSKHTEEKLELLGSQL